MDVGEYEKRGTQNGGGGGQAKGNNEKNYHQNYNTVGPSAIKYINRFVHSFIFGPGNK